MHVSLVYMNLCDKLWKCAECIYLHGTEAVLDESLDPIILGFLQNLIQLSMVLWEWNWAISQEVQHKSKMSATPVQNDPTWGSGGIIMSQLHTLETAVKSVDSSISSFDIHTCQIIQAFIEVWHTRNRTTHSPHQF